MQRPDRDDYAACDCARAQQEGASTCAGCEEYAARDEYVAAAIVEDERATDALMDQAKDEEFHR